MKNIQFIGGAENCTYSIFAVTEKQFSLIFPKKTDVAFSEELARRLSKDEFKKAFEGVWERSIPKSKVKGIHGTVFYGLTHNTKYYPTRKESEMTKSL